MKEKHGKLGGIERCGCWKLQTLRRRDEEEKKTMIIYKNLYPNVNYIYTMMGWDINKKSTTRKSWKLSIIINNNNK